METTSPIFKRLSQDKSKREIAYFTMKAALENDIPESSSANVLKLINLIKYVKYFNT